MNLTELDALLADLDIPVRPETLAAAWDETVSREEPGQVFVLVTMRARPGQVSALEAAAREFISATLRLPGALGSTLHPSAAQPETCLLLERFDGEESFARHMASDYFARFQSIQASLLAEPVTAVFLQRRP